MKASAAKEKGAQRSASRLAHRASGPILSYPKTRIRGSRLLEAAFILAIIELTRRLHQAYEHAYDQQAADWVLPQKPGEISDPTNKIRIIDTGGQSVFEKNKARILRKIEWMVNNAECNAAFRRAGRPTPFDLVSDGKVTLSSVMAVQDSSYNSVLGIPDSARKKVRDSNSPLRTLRNDDTGSAIIFFAADAFDGSYDLAEGVPHEFIHVGGVGQVYGWRGWLPGGHDLSGFSKKAYADIMANCKDH